MVAKIRSEKRKHWITECYERYYSLPEGKTENEIIRERAKQYRLTGDEEAFLKFVAMFGYLLLKKARAKMSGDHDLDDALNPALAEIADICRKTTLDPETGKEKYIFEDLGVSQKAYALKILSNHVYKYYQQVSKTKLEKTAQATGQIQSLKGHNELRQSNPEAFKEKNTAISHSIEETYQTKQINPHYDNGVANPKSGPSQATIPYITSTLYSMFDNPENLIFSRENLEAKEELLIKIIDLALIYVETISRKNYHKPIFQNIVLKGLSYEETAKIIFPAEYDNNKTKARDHTKYVFKSLCRSIAKKAVREDKKLRELLDIVGINYAKYLPAH